MSTFSIQARFLFSITLRCRIRDDGRETSSYTVETRIMDIHGEEELATRSLTDKAKLMRGELYEKWRSTKVARDFDIEIVSHSLTKLKDL